MIKLTNQKILELALTSSDPCIKATVDKLIFALKLKYSEEEFLNIYDNYVYHHGIKIVMPTTGEDMELSVAWKRESFRVISLEHKVIAGTTGDLVNNEDAATILLSWDAHHKA